MQVIRGYQSALFDARLTLAIFGSGYGSFRNRLALHSYRSAMKRSAPLTKGSPSKKAKPPVPDYVDAPLKQDAAGNDIWPAPEAKVQRAREIIVECAKAARRTLIVPDKDADGLSSGVILHRTLVALGLPPDKITVHLLRKGQSLDHEEERARMSESEPAYVFVLDQGSRNTAAVVTGDHKALVIDHHFATDLDFPQDAEFVTACNTPPVATSSLLTYTICEPLHETVAETCDWLCVVGTHGDLGNTVSWRSPFPDMSATFKRYTKKIINEVVSAVNAPRRTAKFDVISAWEALLSAQLPSEVLKCRRLHQARAEVADEVERCTHTAPKFSADGKVAVFRIKSAAQIHPVIATRWAGHLNSKALEIVMVANEGYLDGMVNFSCRIARCAKSRDTPVNIIESLKAYASLDAMPGSDRAEPTPLIDRLGTNFARGHVQASGGIVSRDHFEELIKLMKVGEKSGAPKKSEPDNKPVQKNTLNNYFATK